MQDMSLYHCIFDPTTIDISGVGGALGFRFLFQILHDIVDSIAIIIFCTRNWYGVT